MLNIINKGKEKKGASKTSCYNNLNSFYGYMISKGYVTSTGIVAQF